MSFAFWVGRASCRRALPRSAALYSLFRRGLETASSRDRTPFLLTDIGEGITEVEIVRFLVEEGDPVSQFQPIVEVQSDKANVEITSRYDGTIDALSYKAGDIAHVGTPLCFIRTDEAASPGNASSEEKLSSSDENMTSNSMLMGVNGPRKALATPAVRAESRELGINLADVAGTGRDGRVLRKDLKEWKEVVETSKPLPSEDDKDIQTVLETQKTEATANDTARVHATSRIEPIRGLQRGMVKSMTVAAEFAQLGLGDDVNMERATCLRERIASQLAEENLRFTYMPLFVKATSLALSMYPILNSSIDSLKESIVYHENHNISIAMATAQGLIVPNIKGVEKLSIKQIAEQLKRLRDVASNGKFGRDDLTGGTFSLSNIGTIGGSYASPVVFPPQVGIVAIGSVQRKPIVNSEGLLTSAHMVSVSWAADHRIIDGATLAHFNKTWKEYIENPDSMLLSMS